MCEGLAGTDTALLFSWVMWLYSGFSWLGNLAGEVERPRRTYLAALAILLPLVTGLNLLPFLVSLSIDAHTDHYHQPAYFNELAGRLAGPWLKTLFGLGANVSLVGLYHAQIIAADVTLHAFAQLHLRQRSNPEVVGCNGDADGRDGDGDSIGSAARKRVCGATEASGGAWHQRVWRWLWRRPPRRAVRTVR